MPREAPRQTDRTHLPGPRSERAGRWRLLPEGVAEVEHKLLCRAIRDAGQRVNDGEVVAGYRCLLDGLERAEEFSDAGEAWAEDLAASYRDALFELSYLYPASRRVPLRARPRKV